jgi:acyl-coenzyme A synthetase/AMP-(fatty) acid ligase/very-short-patch-repair endonuclease
MARINSFEEYQKAYQQSVENPEQFWATQAEEFVWKKKWDKILEWNFTEPKIEWFKGAKLNITENCLDRHLPQRANQIAYYWEPNEPNEIAVQLTYQELYNQVCKFANVLKNNGAKKGDKVCVYMPMVPELAIAVLACARIGAVHSVVFGGFSASALSGRIQDCDCKIVITSDGAYRGAKAIPMKDVVDEALEVCPSVEKVIVLERTQSNIKVIEGRDIFWKAEMEKVNADCPAESMDAEDMLFILYTSGSTGKPKGVVHTCGGYMVYTHYTFENVFGLNPTPALPKEEGEVSLQSGVAPRYHTTNAGLFNVLNDKSKRMRNNPTSAEEVLWQAVRKHNAGYHIRRQHIIGQFIVDFVCLEKKLVIEVDGDIHDYQIEEDAARTAFLNEYGFEVIRFKNQEVILNTAKVVRQIEEKLKSINPSPSKGNSLPFGEGGGGVYWCTADIGWITGHSYIVYAPLLAGVTSVMFEGVPTYPDAGRFWQVIDKYEVSHFYTAPTAIRALEAAGLDFVKPYKLDSLRVLGSVGEPINEEAWNWYNINIGKNNCPIVDTWWQTETGGMMISPIAGVTKTKPGFATLPLPGVQPILVDDKGNEIIGNGVEGNLCIKFPWPSIIRTTYGDHERCKQTYFSTYPNLYFTGDGCKRDEDGYYRITGRVDDVMNISGHRIGTAEVESAINMHADIVESAVVGYPHDIKGQGIYAYVICTNKNKDIESLRKEILAEVTKAIGPIAKPDKIQVVSGLPKTRSGKIMRRILRKVAEGDVSNLGDTSTLLDPSIVEEIKNGAIK